MSSSPNFFNSLFVSKCHITPAEISYPNSFRIIPNLAMLFCTLVILSTMGNSFGIRNSYAQQQQLLQPQHPSILTYHSPWSNNLRNSSSQQQQQQQQHQQQQQQPSTVTYHSPLSNNLSNSS